MIGAQRVRSDEWELESDLSVTMSVDHVNRVASLQLSCQFIALWFWT